ncbi:MAG: hypothetical protein JWP66_1286 [Naasia sp.]|nr:hypothetical protein [Naasia sp.]
MGPMHEVKLEPADGGPIRLHVDDLADTLEHEGRTYRRVGAADSPSGEPAIYVYEEQEAPH